MSHNFQNFRDTGGCYRLDLTAVPGNPRKFYRCSNNILTIQHCAHATAFNNHLKTCVWTHDDGYRVKLAEYDNVYNRYDNKYDNGYGNKVVNRYDNMYDNKIGY